MSTTSMMDTPAWTWLRIVLLCDVLASTLGSKVSFPSSNAYNASISSYWSQQESEIAPRCIVSPSSASDVSAALKVLVPRACKFAVRGGGHGAIAGIANIDDGVTIDLGGLSAVTVSSDNKKVKVGGGASWGAVYARLSPLGLAAPGARHATVGVGGSSLGGGFGFFAPKVGFACDNVVQFEVVLANGNIVTASPRTNPNLWRALRGGGNNFGIVTEFTFKTFPLGPMWAGEAYFSASALEAQTQTLYSFTANTNYDLNAGLTVNYAFTPASGPLLTNTYAYAQPVVNPPIFQPFATMAGQLLNNTSVTTLADFSVAQAKESPNGFQEITFATTFENDLGMLRELWAIYTASTNSVANVSGIQWSLSLDPIVPAVVARSDANGGNVLGLRVPAHGLILAVLTATFGSAGDYEIVQAAADKLLADIMEAAKARGVFNPYVDVNHAGKSQDPLASYGLANLAFLKATALHFDPRGVFQTLMPGGFKL
ncbi:2c53db8c-179d-421c-a153-33655fda40b0 [Thermothielavioides terrestris]|uniref:2c53db8c-179d-421c-a153-33655fda40b0 n=1 Tax=Thermothielavioides terrestris TaxID=2587410 RepID=A0A3S4D5V5_9PEZI|nr:2c53db8c-179d-421c-a153-33655fda40b0 [Thermothielavioides terrestris]